MDDIQFDPLFGAAPDEIPLPSAPLVSVLCQVRFAEIVSIQQKSFIAGFQECARSDYPLLLDEKVRTLDVNDGRSTTSEDSVWRFFNEARTWRLTLTSNFLALETRKYVSRVDFIERLEKIVKGAIDTVKPTHVTRIGVRYIDRVALNEGITLHGMLREEMMGITGLLNRENVLHSISEVVCRVKEGQMMTRWGVLPERGTHDAEVMPPISSPSWFLDLDTFVDHQLAPVRFEADMIRTTALELATRSYCFFRWAVTNKFLKTFGGASG